MKVKNTSLETVVLQDIYDAQTRLQGITLQAGVEVTLYDEDCEKSVSLKTFMDNGKVIWISDEEPTTGVADLADKIIDWILSADSIIQFLPTTGGAVHGTPVAIYAKVTNLDGVVDTFNNVATVVVTISSGSATGKKIQYKLADGTWSTLGAGPVTVPVINGVFSVKVDGTSSGDINLALSAGNTSLTKSSTCAVTLT